ncbi:MAG: hypothetical protein VW455_09440 [Nitrospinota bacterium]
MKTKLLALNILIGFILLISLTILKIYFKGKEELTIADEFFNKKNHTQAIVHYERAIKWYVPGTDTATLAAEKFWSIILFYESANLKEDAIKSCRLLRGAFYSTRSFWLPGKTWIDLCNDKIAHWMAAKQGSENENSYEKRKNKFKKDLKSERPPSTHGSLLTEIGFFGWVICAILFLFKAVTPTAELKRRPAIIFSAAFLLFYGVWVFGMFKV